MAFPNTPITELEAVNALLRFIGEQPVSTLDSAQVSSAYIAQRIIHDTSRVTQSSGYWFNKEADYELAVDKQGYINVPSNVLKIDPSDRKLNYVLRGAKLYDKENHTYFFKNNVKVDLVFFLPFEELPQTARQYITLKALKEFQISVLGSELLYQVSVQEEFAAYQALRTEDVENEDANIFNHSSHVMDFMRRFV